MLEPEQPSLERAQRSLQGLSVGDALGGLAILPTRTVPPGPWPYTDDTVMACAVVESLRATGRIESADLFARFAKRYQAEPARGYGPGMHLLFQLVKEGLEWRTAVRGLHGSGSFGNGAAMRAGPIGAYFAHDYRLVVDQAKASALATHAHQEGVAGAIAVAVGAAAASRNESDLFESVLAHTPPGLTRVGIERARVLEGTPCRAAEILGSGQQVTAQDTVPFCLWCVSRYRHSYVECFWATLAGQGDRDTTCAITGSITALMCLDLPDHWVAQREPLPIE